VGKQSDIPLKEVGRTFPYIKNHALMAGARLKKKEVASTPQYNELL
jgi:hypothetical protein